MKKILLILMGIVLLSVAAIGCAGPEIVPGASGDVEPHPMPTPDVIIDDSQDLTDDTNTPEPNDGSQFGDIGQQVFMNVSGIVVSIETVEGLTHVEIEDTDGNPAILVLSDETVFPFSAEVAIGDTVQGWYCANSPMIMIWPPQYTIEVLAVNMSDSQNIKVDRFHAWGEDGMGQFISTDEMFVFMTDENTEVVLQDGQDFSDGDFNNRRIVVIYGPSTRSLPEIATAEKLIVLFEGISPFA
ncbi:MAG: hypothetical protein FWD38_07735 [Oscillospiraceae bacterium]|nr:hypothetical protein [Oscillospiraceae bacterium]